MSDRTQARDILMRNIANDCYWKEMDNLSNASVDDVINAMIQFAELRAASVWRVIEKDGLPETSGKYLVTDENENVLELLYDVREKRWTLGFIYYKTKVIAWKPLPDAYEVKE